MESVGGTESRDPAARRDGGARRDVLAAGDASQRLRAALDAGTRPQAVDAARLVERCAVEPDFFVRDMLTWALTRHPAAVTVPLLAGELGSAIPQARSQALHTLSKIGDSAVWPHLTDALLRDADDEVARAAWRAAVAVVPPGEEEALARVLASQLGRGGTDMQKSLTRALLALGAAGEPALTTATASPRAVVRAHAEVTLRLRDEPDAGFAGVLEEAKRVVALGPVSTER